MVSVTLSSSARTACGRITKVEQFSVQCGFRNYSILKVTTDNGFTGLGEATLEWHELAVAASIEELGTVIEGQDAGRIEFLWQLMLRSGYWRGGPAHMSALSAIDQALWDIKGKAAEMPVYDLLGGRCRDRLDVYANGPRGSSPEEHARSASDLVAQGFTSMKVCPIEPVANVDSAASLGHVVDIVEAIRGSIPSEVRLAIDFHGRLSPAMSIRCAELLEPFDIWFIEEPALPDNIDGLKAVKRATSIPIASGERWLGRTGFQRALRLGVVDVVQPDVAHCGGISEQRRIAAAGEVEQVAFAPHNPLGPIGTIASAHVAFASPNFLTLERSERDEPFWRDSIVTTSAVFEGGWLQLSDAAGLGLELNEDVCREHPPIAIPRPQLRGPDGAYVEW